MQVSEDGWLVAKAKWNLGVLTFRTAMAGPAMTRGVHSAEFTLVSGIAGVIVGVGREWFDPGNEKSAAGKDVCRTDDGWGLDVFNGDLVHGSDAFPSWKWDGQQKCQAGDKVGLVLDCDMGSLTVYLNSKRLGVIVESGLRDARPLAGGGGLCWVVELARKGQAVRLQPQPQRRSKRPTAKSHLQHRRASVPVNVYNA